MARKSAVYIALMGAALVGAPLAGCSFQAEAKAGGEQKPVPSAPAPTTPTPAPTPAPTATASAAPAAPAVTAAPKIKVEDGKIQIPGNIVFDTGKDTLKAGADAAASEEVLKQAKQFLDENPRCTKMRIEGHTDNVGKDADNQDLSGRRALTVKKWLVDHGIAAERLIAVGFGATKPVGDNTTEAGKAQNRRTEFHIAELDGKRFLGRDPLAGGKLFK
jgi:OmpA-OmpF porin, OOP family